MRGRLFKLHAAGDDAAALEVARRAARDFPDEADRATYWIACPLARLGDEGRPCGHAGWARDLVGPDLRSLDSQRFVMLMGTLDPRHDDCRRLAELLRAAAAEMRVDVMDGLAHDYPADFAHRLPAAASGSWAPLETTLGSRPEAARMARHCSHFAIGSDLG